MERTTEVPEYNPAAKPVQTVESPSDIEIPYECAERGFRWVVEFTVSEGWVADGFNLDAEQAHNMIAKRLGYAYGSELGARIIASPDPDKIARAQGYKSADEMRRRVR